MNCNCIFENTSFLPCRCNLQLYINLHLFFLILIRLASFPLSPLPVLCKHPIRSTVISPIKTYLLLPNTAWHGVARTVFIFFFVFFFSKQQGAEDRTIKGYACQTVPKEPRVPQKMSTFSWLENPTLPVKLWYR